MDSFFEKLLVTSLKTTCQIHDDDEMTFSDFYDKYCNTIFNHFEIQNPTKEEFVLVKRAFLNASNDPCSFKSLVFEMSKVDDMDNVEELAFTCIVLVVTSVVKNHRERQINECFDPQVYNNIDTSLDNTFPFWLPLTVCGIITIITLFSRE